MRLTGVDVCDIVENGPNSEIAERPLASPLGELRHLGDLLTPSPEHNVRVGLLYVQDTLHDLCDAVFFGLPDSLTRGFRGSEYLWCHRCLEVEVTERAFWHVLSSDLQGSLLGEA